MIQNVSYQMNRFADYCSRKLRPVTQYLERVATRIGIVAAPIFAGCYVSSVATILLAKFLPIGLGVFSGVYLACNKELILNADLVTKVALLAFAGVAVSMSYIYCAVTIAVFIFASQSNMKTFIGDYFGEPSIESQGGYGSNAGYSTVKWSNPSGEIPKIVLDCQAIYDTVSNLHFVKGFVDAFNRAKGAVVEREFSN